MALPYFTKMTLGTLQLTVEASKTTSIRYLETQFGDGYRARRVDGINPLMERWAISTPVMPIDKLVTLEAEIETLATGHFSWQAPDDTAAKNWVLDPIEWQRSYASPDLGSVSFSLSRYYV